MTLENKFDLLVYAMLYLAENHFTAQQKSTDEDILCWLNMSTSCENSANNFLYRGPTIGTLKGFLVI